MPKTFSILILLFIFSLNLYSQSYKSTGTVQWNDNIKTIKGRFGNEAKVLGFEDAVYPIERWYDPQILVNVPLPSHGKIQVSLISKKSQALERELLPNDYQTELNFITSVEIDNQSANGKILFSPIFTDKNGIVQKIIAYELKIEFSPSPLSNNTTKRNILTSKLSDGDLYKIKTQKAGIYQIDYNFLKNDLGINPEEIDPNKLQLLGNKGGKLPEVIAIERIDDLNEIPIQIHLGNDNIFNESDYILFYADAAQQWSYNSNENRFTQQVNPFDNANFYFLKIGTEDGQRLPVQNSSTPDPSAYTTSSFSDFQRYELDKTNLLDSYTYGIGSGQQWFGEYFDAVRSYDFEFNFPNLINTQAIHIKSSMALRKSGSNTFSRFNMSTNGQSITSDNVRGTNTGNIEATYAKIGNAQAFFDIPQGNEVNITIDYNEPGAEAWLDYIEINARRALRFIQDQMHFRDALQLSSTTSSITYQVSDVNANTEIWDITSNPKLQQTNLSGNALSFTIPNETGILNEFIAFDKSRGFLRPISIGKIDKQNLHGIESTDMLIIYHKKFKAAAELLQSHRINHSNLKVELVEIDQIFNEFSSGALDPTAIRDFLRMLKQRDSNFRYCLFIGDGSFDYKNINQLEENHNYIPVYETPNSFDPIFAYPTDDYYSLLSNNEGNGLRGGLDIASGRLPVRSNAEAEAVVRKIIHYETSPNTLGDWRNNLTFTADDEDSNTHLNQADRIATNVDTTYQNLNIKKIYMDAFEQVSLSGGGSYPAASQAINNAIFKGHLVMNYMGHGGPTGWAQERVLSETDISSWNNLDKLPLFVTATCTFATYDDPTNTSAGEQLILKGDGGAIALFTTVRSVFSSSNERLTKATFNTLFEKINGVYPPIGEILRLAKNLNSADTLQPNARKYTLLGDPAMQLALPKYNVSTTAINDIPLTGNDTLKALQKVKISGSITDSNGNIITDFNGKIFPTVYDKYIQAKTLGNDASSFPRNFDIQNSILFKGAASVNNGLFEFTFVVPKDINYSFGFGKISYYAHDGNTLDATGAYEQITIGGTDANAASDDQGPIIEIFMDDDDFLEGGTTDTDPILLVKVSDEIGINVAGTSIGHDMTARLDANNQTNYVLNDFYESKLDDFTKGEVKYPLFDLEPGEHHIKVSAWDVANNVGFGETTFIVAESANNALEHVLNYPNPFTTSTAFQFEHNLPSSLLDVQIQIFSLSGKLVKTIQTEISSTGRRATGIIWDGLDDFGDKIGRGIYLYKIKINATQVTGTPLKSESTFQKLVILR